MVYADEILDYSGQRKTGVTAGSYGPSADVSPEAGGTIAVPQLTVNEKGLITGAVERTVTLPSGGGGGGEEQFQKVYETTLVEASEMIAITSTDMGGAFVDVVVCMGNDSPLAANTGIEVGFAADAEDEVLVFEAMISISTGASWTANVSVISVGGLLMLSKSAQDLNITTETRWGPPYNIVYPSESAAGVALIVLSTESIIPIGTTITVYARKKVTA